MMWTNRISKELSSVLAAATPDFPSECRPQSRLNCVSEPPAHLDSGDRVRISEGIFCGVEGTVISRRGTSRLLISVELREQSIAIEVDDDMVQSSGRHGLSGGRC